MATNNIKTYFKNLYLDYYDVFKDVHKSAKKRPLRATLYGSSIIFVLNLFRTNEGLASHAGEVVSACNRLGSMVENLRNPISNKYVQTIGELNGHRQLRQIDLGFSTIIYSTGSNPETALYKYNCKYLKPTIEEFFKDRLVDIGFMGHWLFLEYNMRNYDINEEVYKELPEWLACYHETKDRFKNVYLQTLSNMWY